MLVNEQDEFLGLIEKLEAHKKGLCHRAFSIFIFRKVQNQTFLLLQQRASDKYHCPNLWTNTCCSHPREAEDIMEAGNRRLKEEMGISANLTWVGKFHYIAHLNNGLIENEVDHVLVGYLEEVTVHPNPSEVQNWKWVNIVDLEHEISTHPQKFTPWLAQAFAMTKTKINQETCSGKA